MTKIQVTKEVHEILETIIKMRGKKEKVSDIIHEALAYSRTYLLHPVNRIECPHCNKKIPKFNQGYCIFCHKAVS